VVIPHEEQPSRSRGRTVLKGDIIWLLPDADVPFILRPLENGHYKLVGEAYVHGIMHGEALDSDDLTLEESILE
jgi:hypothetical protein